MDMHETIARLDEHISDPSLGLPEEVFLFVSRITPMVNVDLLIKDKNSRTLLSWRDNPIHGKGWHVPGGIVRFQESLERRLMKVAEIEIGAEVEFDPVPATINQIIDDKLEARGHFISILYKCFLSNKYNLKNIGLSNKDAGYLMWHDTCPDNLIRYHEIYRKYM